MTDIRSTFGTYSLTGSKKFFYQLCRKLGKGWLDQRLIFFFRKLVLVNITTPIIDAETAGFKIRYYPADNVSDRFFLFMPQFFDVKELEFMKQTLTPDSTFIDIGGNFGIYSLFASKYVTKGRILTFEPHPDMVKRLTYNIRINKLTDRICIKDFGIADEQKTFNLSINPANLGGNSIVLTNEDKTDYIKQQIPVPCRPLLDVLKEENIQRIDLMKIDIEEAEHLALLPFFENSPMSLFPKNIIIESDDKIRLQNYGYEKLFSTKSHNTIYSLTSHG